MKANKWEWSEFYVFLKILEDKKLPAANKKLEIIPDKFFIFQKVIRNETKQEEKNYNLENWDVLIFDNKNKLLKTIKEKEIKWKTLKIFERIQQSSTWTFQIPEAEKLMKKLLCTQIKAASLEKPDINAVIYDRVSEREELLGFSIKSMLGWASTLLNAGKTTNFIFQIKDLDSSLINQINKIDGRSKIQDRLSEIFKNGGNLFFKKVANQQFESNLKKIDTVFASFVAEMLLNFFSGKATKISDLTNLLWENPNLKNNYWLTVEDYEFKMKNFLVSVALGMVPSKNWDGFTKAHWWYIVVKENGEVICYHLYNRDEFLAYLYENTKFESASSTRHDYGKIFTEWNELFINLNLQIRFLK